MNLQRIKQLAGIKLNESVSAIPGIGRKLSEEVDSDEVRELANKLSAGEITYDEFKDQLDSLEHTDYSMRQGEMGNPDRQEQLAWGRAQHDWPEDDQEFSDQEDFDESSIEMDEKAPPGMEDTVMKLKKEYPGDESKAFATAWSIYNKKHGKTEEGMEEGAEDGFSNNPPTSREAQAMQQRFNDEKWKRHAEDEARLAKEFPTPPKPQEEGCTMEENTECSEEIGRAVEHFVNMVTHSFADPDTAYDRIVQDMDDVTIQEFNDALEAEGLMSQDDEDSFDDSMDGDFDSAMASAGHGSDEDYGHFGGEEFEEAYDFNNGYNDIHDATGDDYFPDGADSPVVSNTGPSGARQGDNPQQKKMQVSEVHKELVYGYRSYLKESKKRK